MILTDIINLFYAPNWISVGALFIDLGQIVFTPMIGGAVNASVNVNYESDILTYQHASLDKEYLYGSSMLFMKDWFYSSTGRPKFYATGSEGEALLN